MAHPYPRYLAVEGRPVKIVAPGEVRAMDRATGAMLVDVNLTERIADTAATLSASEYQRLLDELRQPILERYATAAIRWAATGDSDVPYRATLDGHELTIRQGDFPDEAMYLLRIDGDELYEIDDWPGAWTRPSA